MVHLPVIAMRLLAVAILTVAAAGAEAVAPGTEAEIRERIQPFGQLRRPDVDVDEEAVAEAAEPRAAEAIYDQFCAACHVAGVAGAPRMELAEWDARIAEGMDALYASTINGKGAMPPGGTCFDCSEEELRKVVDWMVDTVQ